MVKKDKGKVIQMLSPENYIRQKARTLPVYECWANVGWEKSQMVSLVIARQHTTGNITAGIYLVDLACLGVKDTSWLFNVSIAEYRKNLEHLVNMEEGIERIEYVLAHNIVHAGIEFAEEYEFKPHKKFTSVTRYILDVDHEGIPVIEIECGMEGVPYYMKGALDSDAKARQVVAQLERVAGHGNYYVYSEDGEIIDDDDDDPFKKMSYEEKRDEFAGHFKRLSQLSDEEKDRFFELVHSLTHDMLDFDKYEEYADFFEEELSTIEINADTIPDEMLGVEPGAPPLPVRVKELFGELLVSADNPVKIRKDLSLFRKNPGAVAAAEYIELMVSHYHNSDRYDDLLKTIAEKYPRYNLVQMLWAESKIGTVDPAKSEKDENIPYNYDDFFAGRDSIHPWEFYNYLNLRTVQILHEKNLEKTEAWREIMSGLRPEGSKNSIQDTAISLFQSELIARRLKII